MDSEQTNDKPAAQKPAAKRTSRKPSQRKAQVKGTPAEAVAAPAAPAADAPAPAPEQHATQAPEAAAPKQPRKPRTPKAKQPKPAEPAPEHKPEHQQAPAEQHTPAPVLRQDREERAVEHVNVPHEQPKEAEPAPAPGFAVPETVGGNEGGNGGNGRRKRRRNRNRRGNDNQPQQAPALHQQVDEDELVRRAWKIYLGEVTEEGLALMDDRTAAEASRRAFRVAELFLQEAARHRRPQTPQPAADNQPADETGDSADE